MAKLTPAFRAAGTAVYTANSVATPTTLSPTKNASTVNGDLMVLVTETRSNTATCATPSGWNLATGFPKTSGTSSGGRIYVFTRIADGTANDAPSVVWSSLTTGTTGDSAGARILSYNNAKETLDGTPPAANDAASTTSITIPAHTTTLDKSLVIGIAMRVNDTAHTFTVATFTERADDHTTSGTGHGTVVAELVKTPAGSSGTASVTPSNTTSSRTLAVSLGFEARNEFGSGALTTSSVAADTVAGAHVARKAGVVAVTATTVATIAGAHVVRKAGLLAVTSTSSATVKGAHVVHKAGALSASATSSATIAGGHVVRKAGALSVTAAPSVAVADASSAHKAGTLVVSATPAIVLGGKRIAKGGPLSMAAAGSVVVAGASLVPGSVSPPVVSPSVPAPSGGFERWASIGPLPQRSRPPSNDDDAVAIALALLQ